MSSSELSNDTTTTINNEDTKNEEGCNSLGKNLIENNSGRECVERLSLTNRCITLDLYYENPSLIFDFVPIVVLAGLNVLCRFLKNIRERDIPYQILSTGDVILDFSLSQTFIKQQLVPAWLLVIITFIAPSILLYFCSLFSFSSVYKGLSQEHEYRLRRKDNHSIMCSLFLSLMLNGFISNSLKQLIGRLRPNFYDMCGFDMVTKECKPEKQWHLSESRKSFPSGHASCSFCSCTIITLYFFGMVYRNLYRQKSTKNNDFDTNSQGIQRYHGRRCMLALSPMLIAFFTSASRIIDRWHHPSDVIAGSLIGITSSCVCYSVWYPGVFSSNAGIPIFSIDEVKK